MITVHYEASTHLHTHAHPSAAARRQGRRGAQSRHPLCVLESIIDVVDMVAAHEREPWLWRPGFIPERCLSCTSLRSYCERHGVSPMIEVDGGISSKNIAEVVKAGANVLVSWLQPHLSPYPAAEVALLQKLGNEAAQEA